MVQIRRWNLAYVVAVACLVLGTYRLALAEPSKQGCRTVVRSDTTTFPATDQLLCITAGCPTPCYPRELDSGYHICGCDANTADIAHYDPEGPGAGTTCVTTVTVASTSPPSYPIKCQRGSCPVPCEIDVTLIKESGRVVGMDSECDCP